MNRFSSQNYFVPKFHLQYIFILLSIILFVTFFYSVNSIDTMSKQQEKESIENSLYKCIIHCYAVEGTYPPNLNYVEEHYGFSYNSKRFFIDYTPIGSNLFPDVTILEKGE